MHVAGSIPVETRAMADARQRLIIKVCVDIGRSFKLATLTVYQVFRKYSHSLGPDALVFLEDILARHQISDEDVESSVETLAQEYNKQDGA